MIIADFLVNSQNFRKSSKHKKVIRKIIAATLIGSGFYIFNYPMVVWAFAIPLDMTLLINEQGSPLISQLLSNFFATIPIMLFISIPIGAILGITGYFVADFITKYGNKNKINTLSNDDKSFLLKDN
jgi:ABC-type transporter Mla maintaining outer membrane lipid asymmetry permease subunit MlaE